MITPETFENNIRHLKSVCETPSEFKAYCWDIIRDVLREQGYDRSVDLLNFYGFSKDYDEID